MATLCFCSNVRMSLKTMLEATARTTIVQSVAAEATAVPQKQLAAARPEQSDSNMSVASHRGSVETRLTILVIIILFLLRIFDPEATEAIFQRSQF